MSSQSAQCFVTWPALPTDPRSVHGLRGVLQLQRRRCTCMYGTLIGGSIIAL